MDKGEDLQGISQVKAETKSQERVVEVGRLKVYHIQGNFVTIIAKTITKFKKIVEK